jgi:hypothetical protein
MQPNGGSCVHRCTGNDNREEYTMRGVLLWAVGIPIPVIILLYVFHVI